MINKGLWDQLDARLVILTIALMVIGIANLYSATINMAGEGIPFYQRQLLWFGVGALIALLVFSIDYRYYEEFAYLFYVVVLIIVVGVLAYGLVAGGGQRWIKLGFCPARAKRRIPLEGSRYPFDHRLGAHPPYRQAARFGDGHGLGLYLYLHCSIRQDSPSLLPYNSHDDLPRYPPLLGRAQGLSAHQDPHPPGSR